MRKSEEDKKNKLFNELETLELVNDNREKIKEKMSKEKKIKDIKKILEIERNRISAMKDLNAEFKNISNEEFKKKSEIIKNTKDEKIIRGYLSEFYFKQSGFF